MAKDVEVDLTFIFRSELFLSCSDLPIRTQSQIVRGGGVKEENLLLVPTYLLYI